MPLLCTMGAATARAFGARATSQIEDGVLEASFPGNVNTATMTTAETIVVTATYDYPGHNIDAISFIVKFNSSYYQEWDRTNVFDPADSKVETSEYGADDNAWSGVGTYTIYCMARTAGTSNWEVVSNTITLSVTAA